MSIAKGPVAAEAERRERVGKAPWLLAHLQLLRPQQWSKNFLVLAALLFAGEVTVPAKCLRAISLFAAFCLVSSAVYIANDLADRKADLAHPRKRHRPIAAGRVAPATAVIMALILLPAGLLLAQKTTSAALNCLLGYIALQAAYVALLKHVVILDVLAVSAGFVLRGVTGAYGIDVIISPWLMICTILLALFISLSKRRSELLGSPDPAAHRRVLGEYNLALLDQLIAVVTSCTILAYILYTFDEQTMRKFPSHLMPLTLPFVLYGIFRYLYLIYRKSEGGEPELLMLRDTPLLIDIALWGAAVAVIVSAA